MIKNLLKVLLAVVLVISLCACEGEVTAPKNPSGTNSGEAVKIAQGESTSTVTPVPTVVVAPKPDRDANRYASVEQNPVVTIEMEDGSKIILELYPKLAPESVENFISLINQGFYDGVIFHRTIPGFMAQGGDPEGTGNGGPGYGIYGEFASNGFSNSIKHERGVLSMARSTDKNSAGSQFFIMVDSAPHLDGDYAAFGRVTEGMEVVDRIVNSEVIRRDGEYSDELIERYNAFPEGTEPDEEWIADYFKEQSEFNRPVNPPVIKKVTVDTFGVEYEEPYHMNDFKADEG